MTADACPPLRLYGHRGSSAQLPENTLAAFDRALADGASALELDVQRTRDGHLVVAHDPDGRRTARRAERIADVSLAEVRNWNVGAGLPTGVGAVHRMPTLDEVLAAFPNVPLSIDIKPDLRSAMRDLRRRLIDTGAAPRVTVGSFHDHLLVALRRLGYPGPTALTRSEVAALRFLPAALCRRMVRGDAAMIPPRHAFVRLDRPRFIARCRALGMRVDYWVVNDPGEASRLLQDGATGLISDDPGRVLPAMLRHGFHHGSR